MGGLSDWFARAGPTIIWGTVGSLTIELVRFVEAHSGSKNQASAKYTNGKWLVGRFLLAIGAGIFAWVDQAQSPLTAYTIGAAAPALIKRFSQEVEDARNHHSTGGTAAP